MFSLEGEHTCVCFFNYVCAPQMEHQTLHTLSPTMLNIKAVETH